MLLEWLREIRVAARTLARTPVWTLTLVLTIALGVAGNASVDGFVRGLLSYEQLIPDTGATPDLAAGIDRVGRLLRVAAIGVFAMACANVASFLLARASARARETAVRVAIGAGRRQLVQQVLSESLVVATAGAAAGAVLAYWIVRIVPALLFEEDAGKMLWVADLQGVAITAGVCAVITLVCGLLPLIETRDDPGVIIQRENSGPSRASIRITAGLVVVQMTACTLLVISAGWLFSSFQSALQTSAGRRLSNPIVVSIDALQTSSKAVEAASGLNYFAGTARVTRDVVGATAMAWVHNVPGNRPLWQAFELETPQMPMRPVSFLSTPFTEQTLDTLIMPPIEGRLFGTLDAGRCGGVVITREAAAELGVEHVLGRSIRTAAGEWADIVGVVAARDDSAARVYHYRPLAEEPFPPPATETYRVPAPAASQQITLDVNVVSANYFDVIGLPVIAGHAFEDAPNACRVAVINREAADQFFHGDTVGGAIIDRLGRRTAVIGVVGSAPLRAAQRAIPPTVYFPLEQDFQPRMSLIAETGGTTRALRGDLHRGIAQVPGGREERIIVTTLDAHLSRTAFAPERIATVLVGASAALAIAIGMLGLHGLISDAARRRQREFALRIALGARGGHLFGQVVGDAVRLVIAGSAAGMAAAMLMAQWIARITPASEPLSPWNWIAAPLTLALAVLVASLRPARKVLASNPLLIMRDDS